MGYIHLMLTTHRQFYQEVGWRASEEATGVTAKQDLPVDYSMTGSPTRTP